MPTQCARNPSFLGLRETRVCLGQHGTTIAALLRASIHIAAQRISRSVGIDPMAGHSKWAHSARKNRQVKRVRSWTKIIREVRAAARGAIRQTRASALPRKLRLATHPRTSHGAIQTWRWQLEGVTYEEIRYEATASWRGTVIDALTDKPSTYCRRGRHALAKHGRQPRHRRLGRI